MVGHALPMLPLPDSLPLQRDATRVTDHLAIGCFASICRDRLGDQLVGFSDRYPDVAVGIHEMPRAGLVKALANAEVAVAIIPGEPDAQFDAMALWSDRIVVALPAGHPLAGAAAVDAASLADELFLVSRMEGGWDMHRFLAGRVLPSVRPATSLRDVEEKQLLGLVREGGGVALMCRSHVGQAVPGVSLLPVAGELARFPVNALWRQDETDPMIATLLSVFDPDTES
jgi:DNA-binding transcriptional LysR family regulator